MKVTGLLERVTKRQKQRQDARAADYRSLVATIADGQEPDAAHIDRILQAAERTLEHLQADVILLERRRAFREQLDALPALADNKSATEAKIAEADEGLEAAQQKQTRAPAPLYDRLNGSGQAIRAGNEARQQLYGTCADRDLLNQLDIIREDLRQAGTRRSELEIAIRRAREEADSDRDEAGIAQWPSRVEEYESHAEELEANAKQMESELLEVRKRIESLEVRERDVMERMLVP